MTGLISDRSHITGPATLSVVMEKSNTLKVALEVNLSKCLMLRHTSMKQNKKILKAKQNVDCLKHTHTHSYQTWLKSHELGQ